MRVRARIQARADGECKVPGHAEARASESECRDVGVNGNGGMRKYVWQYGDE